MLDRDWSAEFPILRKLDFFNHAGVAPLSGRAALAMEGYVAQARDHAYHQSGWYARALQVKKMTAQLLGAAGAREIAFIPNTSTGLSLVAKGLAWRQGDNVVVSNVEYPANRYPWQDLARYGVEMVEVAQQPDGRIDVEDVLDAINDRTRVVSLSLVQYASGFRIDPRPISDMVHRAGGYLCVDAIQALGAVPVNVQAMGIDFLSADGHKWLLGPEGCGVFYVREDLIPLLHPNVVGWMNMVNAHDYSRYQFEFASDARRFEPGSYNIPGIVGLGASVEMFLELGMDQVWARIEMLTTHLCRRLTEHGCQVFSPRQDPAERSGIVIFTPPGYDAQRETGGHKDSRDPALKPSTSLRPEGTASGPGGTASTVEASVMREHDDASGRLQNIVKELEQQNIIIVLRGGRLRASPHFYNTIAQMDRLAAAVGAM